MSASLISSIFTTNRTICVRYSNRPHDINLSVFCVEIQMGAAIFRYLNAEKCYCWLWCWLQQQPWWTTETGEKLLKELHLNWFHFPQQTHITNLSYRIRCQSNQTGNKSTWKHNAFEFSVLFTSYDFSLALVTLVFFLLFYRLKITWRERYLQFTCVALISLLFC